MGGGGCNPRSCFFLQMRKHFFWHWQQLQISKKSCLQRIIAFFISVVPTGGKGTWKGPKPKLNSKASQKTTLKWKRHGIICFQATSCCPRQPPLPSAALRRSRRPAAGDHLIGKYENISSEIMKRKKMKTHSFSVCYHAISAGGIWAESEHHAAGRTAGGHREPPPWHVQPVRGCLLPPGWFSSHSFSLLLTIVVDSSLPQQMVPAVTQAQALTTSLEQQQQQPQQLPQSLVAGKHHLYHLNLNPSTK